MAEFFASVDVAVMGRKTFEKMLEWSPQSPLFPGNEAFCIFTKSRLIAVEKQAASDGTVAGLLPSELA